MKSSRTVFRSTRRFDLTQGCLAVALTVATVCEIRAGAIDDEKSLPPVSERARQVHAAGMLFDGHNDLPWRLRTEGDLRPDQVRPLEAAQFRPDRHPPAARGGREGPVLVGLHPERAPEPRPDRHRTDRPGPPHGRALSDAFEMAYTADDVERIVQCGQDRLVDRDRGGRGDREQPGAAPRLSTLWGALHDA